METLETFIWIALGWIFLNVIIKLLVNSIERIFKGKIDNVVLKIPSTSKIIFAQVIRLFFIVIFAPIFIFSLFIPLKYRSKRFSSDLINVKEFLFTKGFASKLPFVIFIAIHPKIMFDNNAWKNDAYIDKIRSLLKDYQKGS